jgi:FkbM family methyltransferase
MSQIKNWIKAGMRRLGYDIVRIKPTWWWTQGHLRRLGFSPGTVFDVGVGYGTPTLYATFPQAYFVLVEPLVEYEAAIRTMLKSYRGELVPVAAGAREEHRIFMVESGRLEGSSFFKQAPGAETRYPKQPREVAVRTLDTICASGNYKPPFGIKLDVEGFELEALAGAHQVLRETQFVIAELSVVNRFEGGCRFDEFAAEMNRHGFHLADILETARGEDGAAQFVDALFRRAG